MLYSFFDAAILGNLQKRHNKILYGRRWKVLQNHAFFCVVLKSVLFCNTPSLPLECKILPILWPILPTETRIIRVSKTSISSAEWLVFVLDEWSFPFGKKTVKTDYFQNCRNNHFMLENIAWKAVFHECKKCQRVQMLCNIQCNRILYSNRTISAKTQKDEAMMRPFLSRSNSIVDDWCINQLSFRVEK